jgi:Tfp pilus assembly protein PilV
MVAILILGLAITGLVQAINTALASSKESELQTVAAMFAQGKIETLRADKILDNGETEGDCGTSLPMYHWKQSITVTDLAGLHEVSVAVLHAQTGREIYELKTLLFEPDDDAAPGQSGSRKNSKSKKRGSRSS